jgi:Asp-tRNA(Asn)/Glu-tRNA(Gln) amidotransferase A subunit family amidase
MRDTSGAIGSCVADIALLDHVVTGAPLVQLLKSGSLAGKKVAVVEDWIAFKTGGKGVGDTVLRSLEVTKAAFAKAGAEVLTNITGFTEMALTNKDTWESLLEYLNLHWVHGEKWFHKTLVDADVAINAYMWTDRHPYKAWLILLQRWFQKASLVIMHR